jgi:hypothetical protein
VKRDKYNPEIISLKVNKSNGMNALQVANLLFETGQCEFAEPDFLLLLKRHSTNDTFLSFQWSLNNTGSSQQFNGTPGADMRVFSAWTISTGSPGIKVAILDEGVDLNHPDLLANMLPGFDATGLNSAGGPSGNDAHGTACAGIVAAVGNNNLGVAGIAYNSKIVPIRIAYSSGSNWVTQSSWIANSINWAWNDAGSDVLSNSWGGGSVSSLINTAINNSISQGRGGLGAPVLFSAGNSNGAVAYPATNPDVIAVAATSMCDQRKSPSSCDGETFWGSNFGTNLDISAPGVKIYTTDISGSAGYNSGNYAPTFNGTSSACPNAAGVMALILSVNPSLSNIQARQIIESTCDKVGGVTYNTNVSGQPNGSWSNELGHGRVNAFAAVQLANPVACSAPPALANVNTSNSQVCSGGTANLSLSEFYGTGTAYQWQSSNDNATWTNINGATSFNHSASSITSNTWFRCLVTCSGSTKPSNSTQVTVLPSAISSLPHTENFDAAPTLPCGWAIINANNDNRTWGVGTLNPRSAPRNMAYNYTSANAANDWLISPPIAMVAGTVYRTTFYFRARQSNYPEKLEVKWGNAPTVAGMTSGAIFSNTNITNTSYTQAISQNITPTVSGNYHIGWRVFSDADMYDLFIDDIVIEVAPSCTTPTVGGTVSGSATATAGTASTYTLSGSNGTSRQWEISTNGGSTWADLTGFTGTSANLSFNPGNVQVRVRVMRTGCTDSYSNVLNITVNPRTGDNINIPISVSLPFTGTQSTASGSGFSSQYTGTNNQPSPDVFYSFTTGACTDSVLISTCGSGFDTYIHLLAANGTFIFSNDDDGPACAGTRASMKRLVQPNTTYILVVEGWSNSVGSFNLSITEIDNPVFNASITASGNLSFCQGGSVLLTATTGSVYSWNNGGNTQSINVSQGGDYTVTVTNAAGCSATSAITTVNVLPNPVVSISADGPVSFLQGGSVNLSSDKSFGNVWSPGGATTQIINVSQSGAYSVVHTAANGCTALSNLINVTVVPTVTPNVSITSSQLNQCSGFIYTASPSNGGTNPAYQWKKNGINISGANSSVYTGEKLESGDLIACELTSSLFNAVPSTVGSNSIVVSPGLKHTTWHGSNSDDAGDASNYSNGLPDKNTILRISETAQHLMNISQPMEVFGLVVENNSWLIVDNNAELIVFGNIENEGGYLANNGKIVFRACEGWQGTAHEIAANIPAYSYQFNDIELDDENGLLLNANAVITGTLKLKKGNFTNNNVDFTFISTLDNTASIAAVESGASFTGEIIMQRFAPGGQTGWAMISNAVYNARITDWMDDFATSGFPGATGQAGGFISIYSYDETVPGVWDEGYIPASHANNVIELGKGYMVFLGTGLYTTNNITYDVKGPVHTGDFVFPITHTPTTPLAMPDADGWNLVANPYPCAIDWDSPDWTISGLDGAIYIYDADLDQYAVYVQGSAGLGVNGGSNIIASSQGFWVKANTNNPQMIAREEVKSDNNSTLFKSPGFAAGNGLLKLTLHHNNLKDEAIIRLQQNATEYFDSQYDALKLYSINPQAPNISSRSGLMNYAINSISDSYTITEIPLDIKVSQAGTITLSIEGQEGFAAELYLKNNISNTTTAIDGNVTYTLTVTDTLLIRNQYSIVFSNESLLSANSPYARSVKMYPNPGNDRVFLLSQNNERFTVEVFDAQGRLCFREVNTNTISVSDFADGLYFVRAFNADGSVVLNEKLIKE